MVRELAQQGFDDRRFPGADLARDLNEAQSLANPVLEMIQGFTMMAGWEEEGRIGRDMERRFSESIERFVHAVSSGAEGILPRRPELPLAFFHTVA